jgi:ubiquinone/menaquinone biosynthesis C-methylase UbiE
VLQRAVDVIGEPHRLLDVGCGTGQLLQAAAGHLPRTILLGIDPCAPMLSVAAGVVDARLVRAAVEQLPFADAVFDAVTATFTYRHWRCPEVGLREIARVLVPGGVFVLAAILPPTRGRHPTLRGGLPATLRAGLVATGLDIAVCGTVPGYGPITEISLVSACKRRVVA